jgi:protein tyrosine phosphatase (PTP) superfamily phosphohydrolase (DUF442 family)
MLKVFFLLSSLLLIVAGCGPTSPPDPSTHPTTKPVYPIVVVPPAKPQKPIDNYVPGVRNFGFISADVWRGGKPSALGFEILKGMGVATIIDLQEDDESKEVPPGVNYVPIRVSQWKCNQVDVDAVLKAIETSPKPVYIHCLEGRDRTGLAVAAYRLSRGMKADDAITELNAFRVNFWWRGSITQRIRQLDAQRSAQTSKMQ